MVSVRKVLVYRARVGILQHRAGTPAKLLGLTRSKTHKQVSMRLSALPPIIHHEIATGFQAAFWVLPIRFEAFLASPPALDSGWTRKTSTSR